MEQSVPLSFPAAAELQRDAQTRAVTMKKPFAKSYSCSCYSYFEMRKGMDCGTAGNDAVVFGRCFECWLGCPGDWVREKQLC